MTYNLLPLVDPHDAFRQSVTPDLYGVTQYIDWQGIESRLTLYKKSLLFLQQVVDTGNLNVMTLEQGLRNEPFLYEVVTALLAIPRGVGFVDGRELPDPAHRPIRDLDQIASLLIDVGLPALLVPGVQVSNLVRVALTGQDALKRRYRVGATINERLEQVVDDAINEANRVHDLPLRIMPENSWPLLARGRVEYVLAIAERQAIAIASVFQTASGGRQQRDLSVNYPTLQNQLSEYGLNLILVADGRGVREAKPRILEALFSGVASCMTFRQAADGLLLEEIIRLSSIPSPAQAQESRSISRIVNSALSSKGVVHAKELPLDYDRARIALATFVDENDDLDLILADGGASVTWRKKGLVETVTRLTQFFSPEIAIRCFSDLLGTKILEPLETGVTTTFSIQKLSESDRVLPEKLVVAASALQWDASTIRAVAGKSLATAPDSKLSVLLTARSLDNSTTSTLRSLQRTLPSNVVVLNTTKLLEMAQNARSPQTILAQQLLEQSDLVKSSPFVVNSVTPERMFFGRENEEALLISKLQSNSVALLGGRRIGKTSLMRHADSRLRDAGFVTYFGDCQTVRNWDDFARMANRAWKVDLELPFQPTTLFDLVKQLTPATGGRLVFLLDEIDQLLDWDKKHFEDKVPEVFFRACRTISQEAHAQFVFSGERTIAGRLWDPHSPHWNFCQPVMLRQLDQDAARKLLLSPLEDLQIDVLDGDIFGDIAWSRTNGHPQLLQTLGDKLIRVLNDRPAEERFSITADDLTLVADTYAYAEHYLETYWGQATNFERLISLIVSTGVESLGDQRDFLHGKGIPCNEPQLRSALRMLELYGIVGSDAAGYKLQLNWFSQAIEFYGGSDRVISQYAESLV